MIYIDSTMIVFIIALLGMVMMIILKSSELKGGKKSILSRLGENTDHVVHGAYDKVDLVLSHANKNTFIAAIQWVAMHILHWLRSGYIWVYHLAHKNEHSKKVIDMVRGKGELNPPGDASAYLRKISEETPTTITPDIVAEEPEK